jgi:methionyl-tRNA formyltransferase
MRLIVNGQQAFGRAALEKILEAGVDEVVGVYTSPDKEGRPVDPVKEAALEHGLPLFQPPNYKDKDVLDQMRALDADLMVMAYMIIFVPDEARGIPRHGSICFHPSLLPLHRGPSSINWPIIWGSTKTGLSWFFPDDGLDEGDILLQREVDIGPDETLGDIYFKKIFPLGITTTLEAIDLIRRPCTFPASGSACRRFPCQRASPMAQRAPGRWSSVEVCPAIPPTDNRLYFRPSSFRGRHQMCCDGRLCVPRRHRAHPVLRACRSSSPAMRWTTR